MNVSPVTFTRCEIRLKVPKLALKFTKGFGMPRMKQLSNIFDYSLVHTGEYIKIKYKDRPWPSRIPHGVHLHTPNL